jgi:bifunctional N-acetylglucosamine-1-phosphate-uridyltransferase/glucosamine-1-phosphate-acetyltransferase GlmU-like protein
MFITIILAGGEGKRMKSDIPKVLHTIHNKPMIFYVIQKALDIQSDKIMIVVGKYEDEIKCSLSLGFPKDFAKFTFIKQMDALGTGDAVKRCLPHLFAFDSLSQVLILSADVPSIGTETLKEFIQKENAVLTHMKNKPYGCGRILLDTNGKIQSIVEEKDCTMEQTRISLINCGMYICSLKTLQYANKIQNKNAANEYYLTDLIEIAYREGSLFESVELPTEKSFEFFNINTPEELELARKVIQES